MDSVLALFNLSKQTVNRKHFSCGQLLTAASAEQRAGYRVGCVDLKGTGGQADCEAPNIQGYGQCLRPQFTVLYVALLMGYLR